MHPVIDTRAESINILSNLLRKIRSGTNPDQKQALANSRHNTGTKNRLTQSNADWNDARPTHLTHSARIQSTHVLFYFCYSIECQEGKNDICVEWGLTTSRLTTSHSQRLNSGKSLDTGCCKWLWSNWICSQICSLIIREWSRSADSSERSLLLDDLEEYTNSSERSRIRSATVESAERDQCCFPVKSHIWSASSLFFSGIGLLGKPLKKNASIIVPQRWCGKLLFTL